MSELSHEFAMRGMSPYPNLLAFAQPRRQADGTLLTDRRGAPKVRRVHLRSADCHQPQRPAGLTEAEWRWSVATTRRWTTVLGKFGDQAAAVAQTLAAHRCVSLECDFRGGRVVIPPRGWIPHPTLVDQETQRRHGRRQHQRDLAAHAAQLRTQLSSVWPGVARSLQVDAHDPRLPWLVAAATDLYEGTTYDSLRAFVQHHALHTKAREDAHKLLLECGWEPQAVAELGISRSPYLGLGGRIISSYNGRCLDWAGWPGPHDIRIPAHGNLSVRAHDNVRTLLIIENRQAAETACDHWPETALIWCHGQPADAVIAAIRQAASTVDNVIICTDADLGGVRIAARVHDAIPSTTRRVVVDAGMVDHPRGHQFGDHATNELTHIAERNDMIGVFAAACMRRGYAIEQEAPIRAALRATYQGR